jgi:hypothetical protein
MLTDSILAAISAKRFRAAFAALALTALPAAAFAYTVSGVLPAGRQTVPIALHRPLPPVVTFKFSAPPANAGVRYALNYCIGPASNPCGLRTDKVWVVSEGATKTASVPASDLQTKVLVVSKGTAKPLPYAVEVN